MNAPDLRQKISKFLGRSRYVRVGARLSVITCAMPMAECSKLNLDEKAEQQPTPCERRRQAR
jgi:hypothetical protein